MIHFIGYLALTASLLVTCVGLPSQLRVNYKRRSCEGLDVFMYIIVVCAYFTWALYGYLKYDWFIICANVPGVILTSLLLYQMRLYRKAK